MHAAWLLLLLTIVAAAVAAVVSAEGRGRELSRRRLEIEVLRALVFDVDRDVGPADVGRRLVGRLVDGLGIERLLLVGPGSVPELLAAAGTFDGDLPAVSFGPQSQVTRAVAAGRPRLVSRLENAHDPWLCALLPEARDVVLVPVTDGAGSEGVLVVDRMRQRTLPLVERLAGPTAVALRGARAYEGVRRAAAVDGLTGIANRRTFGEQLERETARATRTGEPVSLIMIDIDHFKVLNDTYGHQVGDDVLRQVARVLVEASREYDLVARYGGEEFAVVLPTAGREEAERSARRLLEAVRGGDTSVAVTASLGVATFPQDAGSPRRLVDRADQALYTAKRTGRDRACTYADLLATSAGPQPSQAS